MRLFKSIITFILAAFLVFSTCALNAAADTRDQLFLGEGETFTLPFEAQSEYNIGDPSVISVDGKTVTALKTGRSTLNYTGVDGEVYLYAIIVNQAPSSIKLNCSKKTLYTNKSFDLHYGIPAGTSSAVTFKSSNKKAVSVSPNGKVFAKKKGSYTVTASTYNGKTAQCRVTVKQAVSRIDLSRQRIALSVKGKYKLKAFVNSKAVSKSYKWKSSNKKVASVKGKGKSAVITAKKKGKAVITVKASSGVKQSCIVNVTSTKTSDSMAKQINSQPLYKEKTGFKALDKLVNKIFKKIFKKGYSTYDKVKAIYDYEIKKFDYGHSFLNSKQASKAYSKDDRIYKSGYDSYIAGRAYTTLVTNIGVCTDYAAVFTVMTRALGLDTYSVGGTTTKAGGGWTGHDWNNMIINGKYIVFDAQVEDNISESMGGSINYYRFAKKKNEVKNNYKYRGRENSIRSYKHFKSVNDEKFSIKLELNYGGKTMSKQYVWKLNGNFAYNTINLDLGSYEGKVKYKIKVLNGGGSYYLSGDGDNYSGYYSISTFEGETDAYSLSVMALADRYSGRSFGFS